MYRFKPKENLGGQTLLGGSVKRSLSCFYILHTSLKISCRNLGI